MNINPQNHFNLIEEPWIPVVEKGLVSLRNIFEDNNLKSLGGNPIQKISLLKLFLAIVHAAYTPENYNDWKNLGIDGLKIKAIDYLEQYKDCFWLFGDKPFLQMPEILTFVEKYNESTNQKKILSRKFGISDLPDLPAENNTVLFTSEINTIESNAEKALFLITTLSFGLAGKQVDKIISLNNSLKKSSVAKPGPSLGRAHYLHSFLNGDFILETIYLNVFTKEELSLMNIFSKGIGIPPWIKMPKNETCDIAQNMKSTYIGVLVPLSRFIIFLLDDGLYYTEGIQYPNHLDGWLEPSMSINANEKKIKVLQSLTVKKPWRNLISLLSFINNEKNYDCIQLKFSLNKLKGENRFVKIQSLGLDVSGDSFGQKIKANDDYIESEIQLKTEWINEKLWFTNLQHEMNILDEISNKVFILSKNYYLSLKSSETDAKKIASQTSQLYWQLCEREFQSLVDACDDISGGMLIQKHKTFIKIAMKAYDTYCPNKTTRQLDSWALNRPNLSNFITLAI